MYNFVEKESKSISRICKNIYTYIFSDMNYNVWDTFFLKMKRIWILKIAAKILKKKTRQFKAHMNTFFF